MRQRGRGIGFACFWICVAILGGWSGKRGKSTSAAVGEDKRPAIPVAKLLAEGTTYDGKTITVDGWFSKSFERFVLQANKPAAHDDAIWIYPVEEVLQAEKIPRFELKLQNRTELNPADLDRLHKLYQMPQGGVHVVLYGEFHVGTKPKYGHLG